MNTLQSLLNELALEHETTPTCSIVDELLDEAFESSLSTMIRNHGFIEAVDTIFNSHFSNGDESFENYQSYSRNVDLLLLSSGIDLPVAVLVPSFESLTFDNYSIEAEEKKDNVIVRAAKALWSMLVRFAKFITGRGDKVEEEFDKITDNVNKTIDAANVKVSAKTSKDANGKEVTDIKLKISSSYVVNGKLSFKKRLGEIKATNLDDIKSTAKVHEMTKSDKVKGLPELGSPVESVSRLSEVVSALKEIDLSHMRATVSKYKQIKATIESRQKDLAASIATTEGKLKSVKSSPSNDKEIKATNRHGLETTTTPANIKSKALNATLAQNKQDLQWAQKLYPAIDEVMKAYSDINLVVSKVNSLLSKV